MLNQREERSIPGMVEPIESEQLYSVARNLEFSGSEAIIEFGFFFGRSTNAIAQGLKDNSTFKRNGQFFAYDNFSCSSRRDGFIKHVISFAKSGVVAHLIDYSKDRKASFFPIFSHYLSDYIAANIVTPIQAELHESEPTTEHIALIHIDSPKFYNELKPILFKFMPKMSAGGKIIFQDYFYHWSATLIASVGALIENGNLRYYKQPLPLCIVR